MRMYDDDDDEVYDEDEDDVERCTRDAFSSHVLGSVPKPTYNTMAGKHIPRTTLNP